MPATNVRRGRFAPTPSGQLHIGNALTALAAWLQMRHVGGEFVLRIEDLDQPRCNDAWMAQQIDDLRWLGIDWDEGPGNGGPHAPYEQSGRIWRYEAAYSQLERDSRVYPCYCSRAELSAIARAPHGLIAEGDAYPGICRSLTEAERSARAMHKTPSMRFIMPPDPIIFHDVYAGECCYGSHALSDFVVKRADGVFSYQLAVVVDDAAMGITDVLRGMDLLDSTPRQLALYQALGLRPPAFAHIPLLGDAHGEKLSKRDKSLTLAALRANRIKPQRLIGLLACLAGWIDRCEPVAAEELIPNFRWPDQQQQLIPLRDELLCWLFDTVHLKPDTIQ